MTTTPVYNKRAWSRGYETLSEEYAYAVQTIEGRIPPELSGTLWRNGPGRYDLGGVRYKHPFDGDGMVCAVTFRDGKAHFQNRYVQTESYRKEQAAGKILYKNVFGTLRPGGFLANMFDFSHKNVANTGIIYHAQKLLALWEAAPPHRLDPHTLETVGLDDLNSLLRDGKPFSAHPRRDPVTDELWNFGIEVGLSTRLYLYRIAADGKLLTHRIETLGGLAFIHDFVITQRYAILLQNPMALDPLPFIFGFKGAAECLNFAQGQPTRILLIPHDGSPMLTLETDPFFVFHHVNAYDDGQKIMLDTVRYEDYLKAEEDRDFRETDFSNIPPGRLWRITIDPVTKKVVSQQRGLRACEFPQINPNYVGQAHRYVYMGSANAPEANGPLQALWKVDLITGSEQWYSFAPMGFVGEPLFIPRPGATSEDDGWVMVWVYQADEHRTDITIFDAQTIEHGPIAKLVLPHPVPFGLHGSWSSDFYSAAVM